MIGLSSRCIGCRKNWIQFPIDHGFKFIEINHAWTDFQFNSEKLEQYKNITKSINLKLSFHTEGTAFADPNPIIRKQQFSTLKAELHAADYVGCKYFVTHPPRTLTYEKNKSQINDFFRQLKKISKSYKPQIVVENDAQGYWSKEENLIRIFEAFPNLKMNLDIGHLNRALNEGMDKTAKHFISTFADKIVYTHVHDSKGTKGDHFALGEGTAGEIIQIVKNLGVKNWVIETYDFDDALKTKEVLRTDFNLE